MASPQPPDLHLKPPPQPPESHPKQSPQQIPLNQHRPDPQILPSLAAQQVSPSRNLPQEHFLQGDKDLQLEGEFLAQISLREGEAAEHQSKKAEDHITDKQGIDLALIMQSLQIAIPEGIEVGYQGEEILRSEESSPFQLLMKVACSSGTPRNIPLQPLNEAMSKAWGNNYWIIDQVKHAVYKVYFRDDDAMNFVLLRQPWSLDGDNLLLEWINPKNADKNPDDYGFNFIYVPIRVYGVPQRFRTPHLMQYVIDNVAQPSDIHPPPDIRMVIKDDYISAYAKMDVRNPVKDKVKYYVAPNEYIMFYLNYDRIKRICTFCGLMFHTVQFCPNRRKLILHLQSIGANTASVPFSYVGIWTSQATKIPQEAFEQAKVLGGLTPQFRQAMKVDKSNNSASLSLSNFTLSDSNTGQKFLQGREICGLQGSTERSTQTQFKQKSLLGPLPQLPSTNDTLTAKAPLQDKASFFNQLNSSESPHVPVKDAQQINLATHGTFKRQQHSESSFSEHRLKRQATADPTEEREQEEQSEKNKQNLYQPPQLCYGLTSEKNPPLVGERRIIRPKSCSRWDDNGVGGQPHTESASKGIFQGQAQIGTDDTASTQTLHDDFGGQSVDMDLEAEAPAFKAPRAP